MTTEEARQAYARVARVTSIPVDVLTSDSNFAEHRHARYLVMREMQRNGAALSEIAKRMAMKPCTVKSGLAKIEGLISRDYELSYADAQLRVGA